MIIKPLDLSIIAFCCKLFFFFVQVWGTIIHGKCSIFYLSPFCGEALRILIKAMRRNTMAEVNAYALPKCQLEPPTWFLLFARVSTSLLCRCANDLHGHICLPTRGTSSPLPPPPYLPFFAIYFLENKVIIFLLSFLSILSFTVGIYFDI